MRLLDKLLSFFGWYEFAKVESLDDYTPKGHYTTGFYYRTRPCTTKFLNRLPEYIKDTPFLIRADNGRNLVCWWHRDPDAVFSRHRMTEQKATEENLKVARS